MERQLKCSRCRPRPLTPLVAEPAGLFRVFIMGQAGRIAVADGKTSL
jgi:hypothetical protein